MSDKEHKAKRVTPELLKGFRDYPPKEEIARQKLIAVFRQVFESFGFSPLQTPALERIEVLKGSDYGSDNLESIFSFTGPEEVDMALRFEMTASLARFVAGNPDLPLPFRRYQVGPVWRVDKPGPGRFREFTQFDIDSVGAASMLADAEIIAAICRAFENLGQANYHVRYSNRKILNGIAKYVRISDQLMPDVFRVIDKLEKQGIDAVKEELGPGRIDKSGDRIQGLGLPDFQRRILIQFLYLEQVESNDPLQVVRNMLRYAQVAKTITDRGAEVGWKEAIREFENHAISIPGRDSNIISEGIREAEEGIEELEQIRRYLKLLNIPEDKARIDLTIVRGLGYYTGPVFETYLDDFPEIGSVFAGGRYDGLVERFLGKKIPGTGASAGIDRLLAALMSRDLIVPQETISDVIVTVMDRDKMPHYIAILNEIRDGGIRAEIFLGETKNLTKQLKYADRVGIPVAVILGSDEFERNEVTVKNLVAGRRQALEVGNREEWLKAENIQETIPRESLISHVSALLESLRTQKDGPR